MRLTKLRQIGFVNLSMGRLDEADSAEEQLIGQRTEMIIQASAVELTEQEKTQKTHLVIHCIWKQSSYEYFPIRPAAVLNPWSSEAANMRLC